MKLQRFKEKNSKKVGIILFTISCILLITGVILYRTFAIFQVDTTQNVINGSIEDPGDIYFAFYKDGNIQKEMPKKSDGYVLDEEQSFCGVNGTNVDSIKVSMTEDEVIHVSGVATSRTKCNLYFVKGTYILGKGVPIVENGEGLYEITHNNVTNTLNDTDFQKTEYRYAGADPNNYITFNNEKWRIIGLVNVMTSKNSVEQRVKIIRNTKLGDLSWDYKCSVPNINQCNYVNNWASSSLQQILNTNYFENKSAIFYYGNYDSNIVTSSTIDFNDNYMKTPYSMMIEEVYWNLGGLPKVFEDNVESIYQIERGHNTYDSNPTSWKGKIALPYLSDGKYANQNNKYWFTSSNWYWTLSHGSEVYNLVETMNFRSNELRISTDVTRYVHSVFPTLYLKPSVKIISGTGSGENAYQIVQVLK